MNQKVFPGGRGQKKPHQDTTVRVPRQLADVMKYMANAYRWQLREGLNEQQIEEWWTPFEQSIYAHIEERIQQINEYTSNEP